MQAGDPKSIDEPILGRTASIKNDQAEVCVVRSVPGDPGVAGSARYPLGSGLACGPSQFRGLGQQGTQGFGSPPHKVGGSSSGSRSAPVVGSSASVVISDIIK